MDRRVELGEGGRGQNFLAEIAEETGAGHFSYAELEETDEDLAKLRTWLGKVEARDVLGAALVEEARRGREVHGEQVV